MPKQQEQHIISPDIIRDIIIGMSDGLTVPFAVAAGLSGAANSTTIVVTGGVAEIAAGAIAMGLGGYLSAKTQIEHYDSEERREMREIKESPELEIEETTEIFKNMGVGEKELPIIVNAIKSDPKKWVDFMMKFELNLVRPNPKRIIYSPFTIGGSYIVGGIIPLSPYIFMNDIPSALNCSIVLTLIALFGFGAFKAYFTRTKILKSAFHTMMVGSLAASAAYSIAKLIT